MVDEVLADGLRIETPNNISESDRCRRVAEEIVKGVDEELGAWVLDRVRLAIDSFQANTGRKAVSVYLGYSDWDALKSSKWAAQEYVASRDYNKPEIYGRRIFVVTEKSHLAVC